ncbi:reticulocyte binding protein homologue 4, fragment [Plasmodium sp. DRC-Itaito]|nr:reticulocyte binding protein homologue 4, fragment [Plasmodium sp. DRC-Itaito]
MNKNILWIAFFYFLVFLTGYDAGQTKEKENILEINPSNSHYQHEHHDKQITHHMNQLNIKDKEEKRKKKKKKKKQNK